MTRLGIIVILILGCLDSLFSQSINKCKITIQTPISYSRFNSFYENVYIYNELYSGEEKKVAFSHAKTIIKDNITISSPQTIELFTDFFPIQSVSIFKSKGDVVYSKDHSFLENDNLYDTLISFYNYELGYTITVGGSTGVASSSINQGWAKLPIFIQKFNITSSPEPEWGGCLSSSKDIKLTFAYGFPAASRIYVVIDGVIGDVVCTLKNNQSFVAIDSYKLWTIVGNKKAFSLLVQSDVYMDNYLYYTLNMPPIIYQAPDTNLTAYTDEGFVAEGDIPVIAKGFDGLLLDNPTTLSPGTYTIEYGDSEYEDCIPAVKYLFNPYVNCQYINCSQNCFWYDSEIRDALFLEFEYSNDVPLPDDLEFWDSNNIKLNTSVIGDGFVKNINRLSEAGVVDESIALYKRTYAIKTNENLSTISITSTNPNFIPVKKSVTLNSYQKIDTPDVSISPITCYYDTVKIEKVDVKGGLENGKYKYILSEGDKKKEFDELPITFSKEDFGLGEHTFSLTVEDAQEPEGDTGHEERKSTQSGIKFSFPDELKILKTDIDSLLCHNDNTGRIEITDYTPQREDIGFYVLANNDTISKKIVTEGLAAKEYNLVIHDNKGCKNDSLFVNVNQPDTLDIENLVVKNPKCFGYSDGYINYDVTGGTGEKSFVWNDGFTEKDRDEIPVGEYSVTITDRNKCKITKQMTLTQPEKLNNYFTGDYKICTGSSLTIDSKKYDSTDVFKEFLWLDKNNNIYSQEQILQFDSTNCGKYILISFDEKKYDNARKDGAEIQCHTTDTLNISMSSERFDKSFLVASQSYFGDTIVLVNDTKNDDFDFKFEIPEELEEIGIQDKFYDYIVASKPGVYNLIMSIKGDDCTANEYREIEILNEIRPEDYDEQFVKTVQIVSMKMGPNPNDGNFTFDLVMTEKSDVSLSLYSISRPRLLRKDELKDNNKYSKEYNENLPVGEYMLLVRTENDNKVIKFVVSE